MPCRRRLEARNAYTGVRWECRYCLMIEMVEAPERQARLMLR